MTTRVSNPTVTVAITTYNRAEQLPCAIESALAQTFDDVEVIVLDDGSTDGTDEVAARYDDPRYRYVRNPKNLGMTGNWNHGFQLARGRYVSLLHDDNYWAPKFLERALSMFEQCPDAGFVYAASESELGMPTTDEILNPYDALERLRRRNEVPVEAVIVRRDAFLQTAGFRSDFPYSMDWQLWLEMAAQFPVGYLGEVLGHTLDDVEDRLTDKWESVPLAVGRDRFQMLCETIPTLPLPDTDRDRLLSRARRSLAQAQLVTAWDYAARGDRQRARVEARFAFEVFPRIALTSPDLVAATYLGLLMPAGLLTRFNRLRVAARPILRRD